MANLQRKENLYRERAGTAAATNHSDDSDSNDFGIQLALDTAPNDDINMDVVLDSEPKSSQTKDSDWDPEIARPHLLWKQVSKAGMVTVYTGLPDEDTFSYL